MFTCQEQPEIHDMHTSLYLQNNPANYYSPLHKRKLRVMVQPLWKTVWRFLKELKIDLPYDPAIALLGIYPKDSDAMKRRDTCTPMFIAAMSTIAKLWKELRCPSKDEWKKKMWFMYTMEYYSAIRNDKYPPFALTWMELEGIFLSERSQSEKDKHYMISFIWGI